MCKLIKMSYYNLRTRVADQDRIAHLYEKKHNNFYLTKMSINVLKEFLEKSSFAGKSFHFGTDY